MSTSHDRYEEVTLTEIMSHLQALMLQGTTVSRKPSPFPRRSNDTHPPSPTSSSIDLVRQRSSSDATPKPRNTPIVDHITVPSTVIQSRQPSPHILRRPSAPQNTASAFAVLTTGSNSIGAMSSPNLPSGTVPGNSLHPSYPRSTSRMDSLSSSRDAALSPTPGGKPSLIIP